MRSIGDGWLPVPMASQVPDIPLPRERELPPGVANGTAPTVLAAITDRDIAIAIWQRTPPCAIDPAIFAGMRTIRFSSGAEAVTATLEEHLAAGCGSSPACEALLADIGLLADCFAQALAVEQVEIRLEVVTTDACRKFHTDFVTARLLTSYAGPGTQWLDADNAARFSAGREPIAIEQLSTGDVAILKGQLSCDAAAVYHRSPPIAGTGVTRLVLAINPAPPRSLD